MKKKKKLLLITIMIGIMALLPGCKHKDNDKLHNEETTQIIENTDTNLENNGPIDLVNYSLDYRPGEDCVNGAWWGAMACSENGYYWLDEMDKITFLDKNSGICTPLCSRPDCTHRDNDCVACIKKQPTSFVSIVINYYKGYVYYMAVDGDGYVNLYRVKEDGTDAEKYATLYKKEVSLGEQNEFISPELIIHRDVIYYTIPKEKDLKLYALKMGEDTPQVVFSLSGERQDLYRLNVYGDYLFFQAGNFKNDEMLDFDGGIYALNVNNNKVYKVMMGAVSNYGICDNSLLFASNNSIKQFDLKTLKEPEVILDLNPDEEFACGNNTVLIFTNKDMYIYDLKQKEKKDVAKIDCSFFMFYGYYDPVIFARGNRNMNFYQDGWHSRSFR